MKNSLLIKFFAIFILLSIGSEIDAQTKQIWGVSKLYGDHGGGYIFKTDSIGQNLTPVYSFQKNEGMNPYGDLCDAGNGIYYGVTYQGGTNNSGTLFRYNSQTGSFEVVHNFENTTGRNPQGTPFLASNGKIYGLTYFGGSLSNGVLYEYDPQSNTYMVLVNFDGTNSGSYPKGNLIEYSSGRLFGLTYQGGINNIVVLFEYNVTSDTLIKYVDFESVNKGQYPLGSLLKASNGLLYGLCFSGGINSNGTLFSFNPSNGIFTKEFDLKTSETGASSYGSLIEYNSNLYGLTSQGGTLSSGVLFRYSIQSDTIINMHNFNSTSTGKTPF